MIDKDLLIERITEEQILEILNSYGAIPKKTKSNEIYFNTICHGGKSDKLCYFRDSKEFNCYTNCGKMSLFSLIMKLENLTFPESIFYIAKKVGMSARRGLATDNKNIRFLEFQEIDRCLNIRKKKNKELIDLPKIEDSILNYFDENTFYEGWIEDGISIETMQYFGIRWYELEKYIIIPHENINNETVGIRRRSLKEQDKRNKYMPYIPTGAIDNPYGHSLGLNLYGLNKNKDSIIKSKQVIIVESEKGVMLGHTFYGDNSNIVATCGFNITEWQKDTLLKLGVEEVIIAFDKDYEPNDFEGIDENSKEAEEYDRFTERILSLAYKFAPFCRTYVLWDSCKLLQVKDSPLDRGKEVFEKLMKNKIEITTEGEK